MMDIQNLVSVCSEAVWLRFHPAFVTTKIQGTVVGDRGDTRLVTLPESIIQIRNEGPQASRSRANLRETQPSLISRVQQVAIASTPMRFYPKVLLSLGFPDIATSSAFMCPLPPLSLLRSLHHFQTKVSYPGWKS